MHKKEKEPGYITSPLNTPMLNYRVYVMSGKEKMLYAAVSFIGVGCLGLVFYGGQFRDADGLATTATTISNVVIFCLVGLIGAMIFLPIRAKQLQEKRKEELTVQFRSMLESLVVSLSSGMNILEALSEARNDLAVQYSEQAYIVIELEEMITGMNNNVPIEQMMLALGERSQIDDIINFGHVFGICYRAGGNVKDIVRRTSGIIGEKMEVSAQITTALASNAMQFKAMMGIPVIIVLLLRSMSSSFSASFATPPGVIAITIALGIFYLAYHMGKKIMEVKG